MEPKKIKVITDWAGGKLRRGDPDEVVAGISTDSRSLRKGEMFLALTGHRFDGHEFIDEAIKQGASGVIASRRIGDFCNIRPDFSLIEVKDTLEALVKIAQGYRALFEIDTIAVTGSNGKTTTKELIGQLLNSVVDIMVTPKSYNNLIGVSLSILLLEKRHQAAVFELGMNHKGEIEQLSGICRPRMAVITNVGSAHIGNLGSLEAIAEAKGEILRNLEGDRITFYNADDNRVRKIVSSAPGPVIGFGFHPEAKVRALNPKCRPDGMFFELSISGKKIMIQTPLPGRYNIYNLLGAITVGEYFGLSLEQLAQSALSCRLPSQRMELTNIAGVYVYNDAYNANPVSMRAALSGWRGTNCRGRRIMVSGDMNELGSLSRREHQEWGKLLGRANLDFLIFVGPRSQASYREAIKEGFPGEKTFSLKDASAAASLLFELMEPGDSILIKGSNNMNMGKIVTLLMRRCGQAPNIKC